MYVWNESFSWSWEWFSTEVCCKKWYGSSSNFVNICGTLSKSTYALMTKSIEYDQVFSEPTRFFYKQHFFTNQPQCCLLFSWIELQVLLRCCLIHMSIIMPRHFLNLLYLCPCLNPDLFMSYLCNLFSFSSSLEVFYKNLFLKIMIIV